MGTIFWVALPWFAMVSGWQNPTGTVFALAMLVVTEYLILDADLELEDGE
jgi:hypothetical protein